MASARQQVAASSLTDYYDNVALRGLALAQGDLSRDSLAFERLEAIHGQIAGIARPSCRQCRGQCRRPPADWQREGAILCIPGRGQLDDLAATMAEQVLGSGGFGVRMEPNLVLGNIRRGPGGLARVRCAACRSWKRAAARPASATSSAVSRSACRCRRGGCACGTRPATAPSVSGPAVRRDGRALSAVDRGTCRAGAGFGRAEGMSPGLLRPERTMSTEPTLSWPRRVRRSISRTETATLVAGGLFTVGIVAGGLQLVAEYGARAQLATDNGRIAAAERLLSALKDVETGERGFVITGQGRVPGTRT